MVTAKDTCMCLSCQVRRLVGKGGVHDESPATDTPAEPKLHPLRKLAAELQKDAKELSQVSQGYEMLAKMCETDPDSPIDMALANLFNAAKDNL